MKFLNVLLALIVFSINPGQSSDLGSFEDYAGENENDNLRECFFQGKMAAGAKFRRLDPLSAEELDRAEDAIRECVNKMAKINKKVDDVKDALSDEIFQAFQFFEVQNIPCSLKLKSRKSWDDQESKNCFISTGMRPGDYFCNDSWGKDGCMIDIWRKECSDKLVEGMQRFLPFMQKKQKECVDLFSNKLGNIL